jgi:hypothetical protein
VGNGLQLRFATFAANSLTSCHTWLGKLGCAGGCGVIGVGASRGHMAAVQPGRELWQRAQIDLRAPSHRPNGGAADSLAEAKAAFRRTWEARRGKAGWAASALGGSGPKMLVAGTSVDDPSLP